MSATWLMVALICTSKYAYDCKLETTIFQSRQECIEDGLLERRNFKNGAYTLYVKPNRYCSGPDGNSVASDSEEVLMMQEEFKPCIGLCQGYNPNFRYNIETKRMEPAKQ